MKVKRPTVCFDMNNCCIYGSIEFKFDVELDN